MRKRLSMLGVVALIGLFGCGGSNGSFNNPNPFAGNWTGSLRAGSGPTEQFTVSIGADGAITGTETVGSSATADTGVVHTDGDFGIRSRLAGTPDANLAGNMFFGSDGFLHGDGTETQSGNPSVSFSFDLRPQ